MKNVLLLFVLSIGVGAFIVLAKPARDVPGFIDTEKEDIIACVPSILGTIHADENGKYIIPLPGWGHHGYAISTHNDSAQFYFNQGLSMYYSYHMKEAAASFKEAARFDSDCAIAYWGEALSMGPSYNSAHTYQMSQEVLPVLEQMNRHVGNATLKEKSLIDAMNRRYSSDISDKLRDSLNLAYAHSLKELVSVYPDDADIKMLYVDAMMLIHPWDFWNNDGSAKEWTLELVNLCAELLKKNPDHPAALHYYIHLTEASRHPEVALANAEQLRKNFPGVAHMVHMASHEYERNGFFAKGVEVNDRADDALGSYDSVANNLNLNRHSSHYFAVQTYCALSAGMYNTSIRDALRCRNNVSPGYSKPYYQYLYMMPFLARVRLGKWKEILLDSIEPDKQWTYALILYHFSRGLAQVYTGRLDSGLTALARLRDELKDTILNERLIPFNAPLETAEIAEEILSGAILFAQKKYDMAIRSFENAIRKEDLLIYTEPKDWPIPARQFLGAYLMKLGRAASAEKIYREDLVINPGNGWSQLGIYQSLKAQHKTRHLAEYHSAYLRSFSNAESAPPASAFIN